MRGAPAALLAAALLGLVSAFADWLWAAHLTDGALLPAVVHGTAIFALLGTVLSLEADSGRSLGRHLLALPVLGLVVAGGFYPVAALVGYLPALLASWLAMWVGLALARRWATRSLEPMREALLRGLVAGIASGVGFWAISGIWTEPGPSPVDFGLRQHGVRALQWTLAFLPGFVALMWRRDSPAPHHDSDAGEP